MAHPASHVGLTASIVDSAVKLHKDLGPGMFESTYEMLLADVLAERGHKIERQVVLPVTYRGRVIEQHSAMYRRQLLTFLRFSRMEVGLVLNFGLATMKDGIDRVSISYRVP